MFFRRGFRGFHGLVCEIEICLSHIPLLLKVQQDLLGDLVGGQFRCVDGDVRVAGLDVRVTNKTGFIHLG